MKHKILLSVLLLCCGNVFSQTSNDKVIYLDSLYNLATETNYTYIRIVKDYYTVKKLYEVNEYYKTGEVKTLEVSSNKDEIFPVGSIRDFYQNGQKKSETETTFTVENGTKNIRVLQFWDKNKIQTVINGNGECEIDNGELCEKGKIRNGNKIDEWTGTDKKHNFTYVENYVDGKLISGISTDSNKIQYPYTSIYKGFGHGKKMHKLMDDISGELLSKDVINKENAATLIINVDNEGKLSSIRTTPDVSHKLGKIIKKYKHKTPIIYRGIPIPYSFSLTWTSEY